MLRTCGPQGARYGTRQAIVTALDFVTTESIVEELKRRYPLLLVAGSVDVSKTHATDLLLYHGNAISLIGLASVMKHDLTTQYLESLEPTDDTP